MTEPRGDRAPGTILIADDNSRNVYLLEVLLRGAGYDVVTAKNGKEALEKLRAGGFDGIVSDILMPVMDGFTLIRECGKDPVLRRIPFIFYTATYTEKKDEEFGLALGALRYIIKPAEPEDLLREIRDALHEYATDPDRYAARPPIHEAVFDREYSRRVGGKLDKRTRQLEESEEKFRTVVENIPDIILVHRDGAIVFVNNAVSPITGFLPVELVGKPITQLIAPEYQQEVGDTIRTRKCGEPTELYEVEIVTKSGSRLTVLTRGVEIEFKGAPASLKVLTDVTERKKKDEQIRLSTRKLALMREVTYQDIKNKVTALRGLVALGRMAETEEERLSYVETEERILTSIHSLIESTKDYQHLGEDQSCWIPVDYTARLQFAALNNTYNLELDCDLHELEILADPLFDRVIFNILQNTVRHGGKAGRISISAYQIPAGLVLVVADDGIGIPEEMKARIFERTVGYPGQFGLFFVREFLEISGMAIAETGIYGTGARFEITIPKGRYRFGPGA
jgi:PAS domain S-box-containing protein